MELRLDESHSLKEKRNVLKSLQDRLRHKFNVSVAEIGFQDLWQRGLLSSVTVSSSRSNAEITLRAVENEASLLLGPMLVSTTLEWLE